jgi:hypothetical protein
MATRGTVMPSLAFAAARRGRRTFLPLCPAPRALATIRLQQNGMGLRCVQGRARFGKASCPGEGEADETEIRSICASIGLRASGTYSTHVPRSSRRLHSPITPADLRYYNKAQGVRIHWWHTCTGVCLSGGRNIEGTPRSTSETTP